VTSDGESSLKNWQQCGVIDSVKCGTEVKKYKNNYMTLVNGTDNIIVDYQHCGHCRRGRMELTVGGHGWKRELWAAWLINCLATTRSIILDKKVRLEMGRNELRSSGFIAGFQTCSYSSLLLWAGQEASLQRCVADGSNNWCQFVDSTFHKPSRRRVEVAVLTWRSCYQSVHILSCHQLERRQSCR